MPAVQHPGLLLLAMLGHVRHAASLSAMRLPQLKDDRAASADLFKEPKWKRESDLVGFAKWECGQQLSEVPLNVCDDDTVATFQEYAHMLADNYGMSQVAGSVVLMAKNASRGLHTCLQTTAAFRESDPSVHNPLRVIVDAQYVNRPRCCYGSEVDGLVLNDDGENFPWTNDALAELENITEAGMTFFRAMPKVYTCTEEEPCPLVVQIAGAAGNPWFLVQNHCSACQKELGVVAIAPVLEKDMFLDDGECAGSSNDVLTGSLIPFLETYIATHPEINAGRVYVVAQSQGDDTALRLGLLRPDLISMVSLAGKNAISNTTIAMLHSPDVIVKVQSSRLEYIQWNVGDEDTAFEDEEYFPALAKQLRMFSPGFPRLDLRIYPQSFHSVWWATWNSLHEVIWTGQRSPAEAMSGLTTTCRGAESIIPEFRH